MKAQKRRAEEDLAHYTCFRTGCKIEIDGNLDKPAWRKAPKSHRFVDLVSGVPGFLDTRMASLWDDENLYVAFWVDEPNVRARLAKRDSLIWTENDVDKGWTAEIAFPWRGMKPLAGSRPVPPRDGDVWRMDFSRFELLEFCGTKAEPHPGWALNRHGVYNSHIPECFSFVHFSEARAGQKPDF
jgi:hypothetical protein